MPNITATTIDMSPLVAQNDSRLMSAPMPETAPHGSNVRRRQSFVAEVKLRILAETDRAAQIGETWSAGERCAGALRAMVETG